jgi:hypothetical protein
LKEKGVRPPRDHVYDAWVERNTYTTTLLYSAFIAILLPAFHYVLALSVVVYVLRSTHAS